MNEHHITFEGAPDEAVRIATEIADVDGVDLTSSEPPVALADGRLRLGLTVHATAEVIRAAVDELGAGLDDGGSITLDAG